MMKLTTKQLAALHDAKSKGTLFQLPERPIHSMSVLNRLCKAGLLERMPVGVIWVLTDAGRAVVESQAVAG